MSVVLRRVPADWEHPKNPPEVQEELGTYIPQYPEPWDLALKEWRDEEPHSLQMLTGEVEPNLNSFTPPPDPISYCRFPPGALLTHYQLYEEVSFGTPVSPVFEEPKALVAWMVGRPVFGEPGTAWTLEDAARFVAAALEELV